MIKKTVKNPVSAQVQNASEQKRILKEQEAKMLLESKLMQFLALIVAVVGFILYINTLNHHYALDDYSLIIENASTKKGFAGLGEIFKTSYRHGYIFVSDEMYRPLSKAMFAIEWELAPNTPALGHWVNVLLYSLTGFLITVTLYKYFKSVSLAFFSGLLFMVHPIHTEVVANIKSRDEILALVYSVLTLFTWKKFTENKKSFYILLTALFFFLALLSKESAITFIGVFALLWYFFFNGKSKSTVKPLVAIAISVVAFMLIRSSIVGNVITTKPSIADNLLMAAPDGIHRFATAVYIMGLYIKLLFIPYPLVFDYSFNQIPIVKITDWRFVVSFILIILAGIMALVKIKSRAPWVFAILFFFITVSISSNILVMIGTNMAERLMYTPSLGFCIAIGYLITKLFKVTEGMTSVSSFFTSNWKSQLLLAVIVFAFSGLTIARNPDWKNNYSLYSNDVKLSPNSTRTHYYLGNYLIKEESLKGRTAAERDSVMKIAVKELRKSLEIYPPFVDAWNQLGVLYHKMKDMKEAMNCYNKALQYNPNEPTVHNNIGTIYFEIANFPEAEKAFRKAIEINPNYVDAYNNLGSVLGMVRQYDAAIIAFQRVIQLDPGNISAWHYTGITYQLMGNELKAQEYFGQEKALKGN